MEAYEKGLITTEETGGLDLTWGNAQAMIEAVHAIARREGIGDTLADGDARAAIAPRSGTAARKTSAMAPDLSKTRSRTF